MFSFVGSDSHGHTTTACVFRVGIGTIFWFLAIAFGMELDEERCFEEMKENLGPSMRRVVDFLDAPGEGVALAFDIKYF